jgi:hypothetical protein
MTGFRRGLDSPVVALGIPQPNAKVAARNTPLEEADMLLHLPIAILASLSPIAVSDAVPKFDILKECRFEGGSTAIFDRCSHDEADALAKLQTEWPQFANADRNSCFTEATVGGMASYVDLLICLEMARDVRKEEANTRDPLAGLETQSARPAASETNVVDEHK